MRTRDSTQEKDSLQALLRERLTDEELSQVADDLRSNVLGVGWKQETQRLQEGAGWCGPLRWFGVAVGVICTGVGAVGIAGGETWDALLRAGSVGAVGALCMGFSVVVVPYLRERLNRMVGLRKDLRRAVQEAHSD